jgi:RHS repeat-associated protein
MLFAADGARTPSQTATPFALRRLRRRARRAVRPRNLRRALVCLMAFAVLLQSNLPLVFAFGAMRAAEQVRVAAERKEGKGAKAKNRANPGPLREATGTAGRSLSSSFVSTMESGWGGLTGYVSQAGDLFGNAAGWLPSLFQQSGPITDAAVSRHRPSLNGGSIEGSLRVFSGESFTFNTPFQITGDVYTVGNPQITVNSGASYGGKVDDAGSATPSGYPVTLNGGFKMAGKIHVKANALVLPQDFPASVPAPSGTRTVNINTPADVSQIGDWRTVRDLNVAPPNLVFNVPPGNYGTFSLNGASRLNFTTGTYNFAGTINLNSGAVVESTGKVTINVGQAFNLNSGSFTTGAGTAPGDIILNALGTSFSLNNTSTVAALVRAPNANVNFNGTPTLRGQVIANYLNLNGGKIVGNTTPTPPPDAAPPVVHINSPLDNSTTTDASVVVTGTATDTGVNASGIATVTVNNQPAVYNAAAGTWSIANVPLALGPNTINASALDVAGNRATVSVTVTRQEPPRDTTPPALSITSPSDGLSTQSETITVSGTVGDPAPNASGVAGVNVNGVAATRDVLAGTWSAAGVSLALGPNTITAHATDVAGNVSTKTVTVTREPVVPPDTQAPSVRITSPLDGDTLYDTPITVTGTAADEGSNATGVRRVVVNGVNAVYNAGANTWTASGVSLVEGSNVIKVEAEDASTPTPNKGTAQISVTRRIVQPPTLTITSPQTGTTLNQPAITVAGEVAAGAPGVAVNVTVNGEAAQVAGGQFTKTVALSEGANALTVVATDARGQTSQASVTIVSDRTPPTVALSSLPAVLQPGASYLVRAEATDNVGVAAVEFSVNGRGAATLAGAPYEFTLAVPSDAAANETFEVSALARDAAGATSVDTAQARVAGPGGISGYVFDDATGYVLAGVSAAAGASNMLTTADGTYTFVSTLPSGIVRLSKTGYTPAERVYELTTGEGLALFDARLTPLDAQVNRLATGGGSAAGGGGRLRVIFGEGSFVAGTDVRVTSVSPQGLVNLLPFGWSPVPGAVVDVRAADGTAPAFFTVPAQLTVSETQGLGAGASLVLARYDEARHGWYVLSTPVVAGASGQLSAQLPGAGQYAFLVPDAGETAPPVAVAGQALAAGPTAQSSALDGATGAASASPRTAVVSPDAKSTISVVATSTAKLPSGVAVEVSFDETYHLLTEKEPVFVDRPTQDFVLYAYPSASAEQPNRLGAAFVAKPTRADLTVAQLRLANVHVTIRSGRGAATGVLVGPGGGRVSTRDGGELIVGAGALNSNTPLFLDDLAADDTGLQLPEGYEVVKAFSLETSGASLSNSATLTAPALSGDNSRVVLARVVVAGGRRLARVVARAVVEGGVLRSNTSAPAVPEGVTLAGVTAGGRYAFIRVPQPFGYVRGVVADAASAPLVSALVSTNRTPFVDVTGAEGRFVLPGGAGPSALGQNEVAAASLSTDATGSTTIMLGAQDAVADASVTARPVPFAVASVSPAGGATDIIVTTPVSITFSKPVAPQTLTGSALRVTTDAGLPVIGTLAVLAGNRVAVFTPSSTLLGAARYKVQVGAGVQDVYGQPLGAAFESSFTTAAAVTVNNRLRPERIRISYPNEQGLSTVIIPGGSVPPSSVIVAINNASGATITTVAAEANLTLNLQAEVGDEIVLIIRQPDGTEYRVSQAAYKRADGFSSVGVNGGAVSSDDGALVLDIPKDAISGQAEIKLTPKDESSITTPRGDLQGVPFGGGVEVKTQGTFTVEKELHLELPAPAGMEEGRRVSFVSPQKVNFEGQDIDTWMAVTSGRVEGGKFKSSSPPFFGIGGGLLENLFVVYVFAPVTKTIVYGKVTERGTDKGVPNALCLINRAGAGINVAMQAGALTTLTNKEGGYAIFDFVPSEQEGRYVTVIDDRNSRRGYGYGLEETSIEGRFLQGLTGYLSLHANITLPPVGPEQGVIPAPSIALFGRRAGVAEGEEDSLATHGVVPVGVPVRIYAASNAPLVEKSGQLLISGVVQKELTWTPDAENRFYTDLELSAEGSYTIRFKGATVANEPRSTTNVTYNFICLRNPNTRPPLAGPPRVLTMTPADASANVDMATDVRLDFSEPVHNLVPGETLYVEDGTTGERVGGTLTSGGVPVARDTKNVSSIVFKPSPALVGGRNYCVNVQSGVVDDTDKPLDQEFTSPDDTSPQPFKGCFKTFEGMLLTPDAQPEAGDRLATAGQFVYTVAADEQGRSHLKAFDVSEPQAPRLQSTLPLPQRSWAVAASEDEGIAINGKVYNRIVVVGTTSTRFLEQYANLWVISYDEPSAPQIIGVTSIYLPQISPSVPLSVRILNQRAYVGNVAYNGTLVVDLPKAISLFETRRGRVPGAPNSSPVANAVTAFVGYGHAAKAQTVLFNQSTDQPNSAMDVAVLNQTVFAPSFQGGFVEGSMPVAYVVDSIGGKMMTIGFPKSLDGWNTQRDLNGDQVDERILARTELTPSAKPLRIRAVSNVEVPKYDAAGHPSGVKLADLALIFNGQRFWIFDVTMEQPQGGQAPGVISHTQLSSKVWTDLDRELTGTARSVDVEGTLLYATFGDKVAVIDFSDPTRPRVIGKVAGLGDAGPVVVKDGFIYTLGQGTGELKSSIARPASVLFVHGRSGNADTTCSNPVIIDRQTRVMKQSAEIFFQIFGQGAGGATQVTIRKNGSPITTVQATLTPGSNDRVVAGRALWTSGDPIDPDASYTAELNVNQGQPGEYNSLRAAIPFSFLITEYETAIGILSGNAQRTYGYVLGANATVNFEVNGASVLGNELRTFGLNVDKVSLPSLAAGRYQFTLRAAAQDDPSLTDQVSGIVEVSEQNETVRRPGSSVVNDVDLGTGGLGLTYGDLDVAYRGGSLAVTRSYNSGASNVFSPFGYGWHHNFQVLLVHDTTRKQYSLIGGDGSGQTFKEETVTAGGEMRAEKPYHAALTRNGDGSFDYYTKAHVRYHFPGALDRDAFSYYNQAYVGNLEYIEDANKNRLTLEYDEYGRMTRVADPAGRSLEFEYELAETPFSGVLAPTADVSGTTACSKGANFSLLRQHLVKAQVGKAWRVKAITGPGQLKIEYAYDQLGNLARVTRKGADAISQATSDSVWQYAYGPAGASQTAFDTTHLLVSATDPNGNATSYQYELGQIGLPVKQVARPEGVTHTYTYQFQSGKVTQAVVTDGNGQASSYELENGYTKQITGPLGAVTTMGFNDEGLKTFEVDPAGMRTDYGYDARGNLSSQRRSGAGASAAVSTTFDQTFGKPTSQTDANGKTTSYTLDGHGNVTSVSLPTGSAMRMSYSGQGDIVQLTDERGFVTTFGHDAFGNTTAVTRQSNGGPVTTASQYDERNRLVSSSGTLQPTETNTFDALDHLVGVTSADPSGVREPSSTNSTYKPGGQLLSTVTNGGGQSLGRQYTFDGLDRVTQLTETVSGAGTFAHAYSYDRNSNLLGETDRRGVTVAYVYDALNFRTSETVTGPHGGTFTTSFERDKVGDELSVTNLYGQKTTNTYDGLHRLVSRLLPGGYTEQMTLDANGNVLTARDRNGRETIFAYDAANRPTEKRDPAGRVTTWAYDDANSTVVMRKSPQGLSVTTQTDALNRPVREQMTFAGGDYTTSYLYNGLTVEITDPRGVKTLKSLSAFGETGRTSVGAASSAAKYSAFGGLTFHKDADGRETNYTTDALGRSLSASYTGGFNEAWSYDGEGNMLSHTDRRGIAEAMTYDNLGRLLTRKVGDTSVLAVAYDAAGNETRSDARGQHAAYDFDGLRRLTSVTNAEGRTKTLRYDGMNLLGETDFKGAEAKYLYDAANRVTSAIDRAGRATGVNHSDAGGHVKTVTDRRGNTRVETFDALERLVSVSVGGARVVAFEYDGNDNRTAMIDGRGKRTAYAYDDLDRVKTITHAGGQVETFTYDNVGNVLTYNDGFGGDATLTYDALNHPLTQADGAGDTTTFQHDGEGLLVEKTEPEGGHYGYTYNALRSLTGITDPAGAWAFGYDPNQNLSSAKDALGRTTSYGYDSLNRLTSVAQPLVPAASYTYDENGNRLTATDPKGQTASFGYDAIDRLTTASYAAASGSVASRNLSLGYDPEGNLTSVSETDTGASVPASRNYARAYDARNRVTSETDPFGRTSSYGYDGSDNVTSYTDAAGRQTAYGYDDANRLATVNTGGGGAATYSWNPDGLLKEVAYPGGMKRAYSYDAADRVKSIVNAVGNGQTEEYAYAYDKNSNRVGESRKYNGAETRSINYGYDPLNRLTSASYSPGTTTPTNRMDYTYDAVGNRLTARGAEPGSAAVDLSYSYDALNRVTSISGYGGGAVDYGYDNNGNMLTVAQSGALKARYDYDSRNQLRGVTDGAGAELARYDYDFLRRRLTKGVGSATTQYAYWGDRLTDEFDGASRQLTSRYDFGDGVIRGELGGEGERWYFSDALGSVTALSKLDGQSQSSVAARYEYTSWGAQTSSGASSNQLGYTGQRLDVETGLMAMGNGERYYSPLLGRFTQQDSWTGALAEPQTLNRYAYANGNPLRFVDPSGNQGQEPRGRIYRAAQDYGFDEKGHNNWWNITKNAAARTGYDVWNLISFGALARQEEIEAQLEAGEIDSSEANLKTGLNALVSFGQLGLAVATGGAGNALTVGAGLTTRVAVGAGLAMSERFAGESLEKATGFREEYSSAGSYAVTGLLGGAFGAATPGRSAARMHAEGTATVASDLGALKSEFAEAAQQVRDGAGRARRFAQDFGEGFGSYKPRGVTLSSNGAGEMQELYERTEAGLRKALSGAAESAEGVTLEIKKPRILSRKNLSPEMKATLEGDWVIKQKALKRAAQNGELKWSPGTENVRIKELQSQYREAVAARYQRRYGVEPDMSMLDADHMVDLIVGGAPDQTLKLIHGSINRSVGASLMMAGKRLGLKFGTAINDIIFK